MRLPKRKSSMPTETRSSFAPRKIRTEPSKKRGLILKQENALSLNDVSTQMGTHSLSHCFVNYV